MPLSFSHPLHQLRLRDAQRRRCVRELWLGLKDNINGLRTRELPNVIKYGSTELDDRLRLAMDRLYETRGRAFSGDDDVISDLQHGALNQEFFNTQPSHLEKDDSDLVVASFVDIPMLPPSVSNLRQTPRRPVAPSLRPLH